MRERYLTKDEARAFMEAELGIVLNERQMRRAVEKRKLPFFPDPVSGRLRIAESAIRDTYARAATGHIAAPHAPHPAPQNPSGAKKERNGKRKGGQGVHAGGATFRARHGIAPQGANQ